MEIAWKSVRSIVWKMKKLQKSELFSKRFPNRIEHPGGELAIHDFYQKIVFGGRKETFNPIIFTKNVPRSPHLGINISLKFLGELRSTFPYNYKHCKNLSSQLFLSSENEQFSCYFFWSKKK